MQLKIGKGKTDAFRGTNPILCQIFYKSHEIEKSLVCWVRRGRPDTAGLSNELECLYIMFEVRVF